MWSFLPSRARLLLRWSSLPAAAIVRPHIIRGTAAITVILATRITATTRAISALAGEATTGLGGGIGTTAGIMADGTGGADAAGTVVAGMAADGTAIIDSESQPPRPRVFRDSAHATPVRGTGHAATGATSLAKSLSPTRNLNIVRTTIQLRKFGEPLRNFVQA